MMFECVLMFLHHQRLIHPTQIYHIYPQTYICLEGFFIVNTLVFRWPKPLWFMVFGGLMVGF